MNPKGEEEFHKIQLKIVNDDLYAMNTMRASNEMTRVYPNRPCSSPSSGLHATCMPVDLISFLAIYNPTAARVPRELHTLLTSIVMQNSGWNLQVRSLLEPGFVFLL